MALVNIRDLEPNVKHWRQIVTENEWFIFCVYLSLNVEGSSLLAFEGDGRVSRSSIRKLVVLLKLIFVYILL